MTGKVCEKVIINRALRFDPNLTVLDSVLSFTKGVKAMRFNVVRFVLVISTAIVLSGCYSGGRWTTPNLAFWKRSPFQSTPSVAPSMVGAPVKPSQIAASNGGANTLAPPANYASTGANTMGPPVASVGTPVGYSAPETGYPTSEYPSTAPPSRAPAYTASTAGVPGARAYAAAPTDAAATGSYGSTSTASPYSGANPYATSQAASPYSATPSTPSYSPYNATASAPAAYTPTATPSANHANPVRSAPTYPSTDSGYPSGSSVNASHDATNSTDRYASPAASSQYGTVDGSSYGTDSGPRYAETVPNASGSSGIDATATSGDRYATPDSSAAALVGSRYAAPTTTGNGGYTPSASSYDPGTASGSGYSVPDASGYAPPGGFSVPSTDNGSETPAYRPGSTSDYTPGTTSASNPSMPYSTSGTSPSVSPASYTSPSAGTGM